VFLCVPGYVCGEDWGRCSAEANDARCMDVVGNLGPAVRLVVQQIGGDCSRAGAEGVATAD
jgi:hypothetical protein